jgi:hypothetical protein
MQQTLMNEREKKHASVFAGGGNYLPVPGLFAAQEYPCVYEG